MHPRRNRPSAFDVSFPEEAGSGPSLLHSESLKRRNEESDSEYSRELKRRQLPPVSYFHEDHPGIEIESLDVFLTGEDPFDNDPHERPIRLLTNFTFFDSCHANEMVPIDKLDVDDDIDRKFQGVGLVFPYSINEEDDGQDDDDTVEAGRFLKLHSIQGYTFDVTQDGEPVWIETEFAWYSLQLPSAEYAPYFQHFYAPRRVAQMVISSVKKTPDIHYDDFLHRFIRTVDAFGRTYRPEDLRHALGDIQQGLEGLEENEREKLKATPFLRQLLQRAPVMDLRSRPYVGRPGQLHRPQIPPIKSLISRDLDLAVLRPENQTPTHVTPLVASLAKGMVYEDLQVLGPPPPLVEKSLKEAEEQMEHTRLQELVNKAKTRPLLPKVDVEPHKDYIGKNTRYLKSVRINGEMYNIGDFVIVPIGIVQGQNVQSSEPPDDVEDNRTSSMSSRTLADYFWFAKVLYGDADRRQFHVQWLQHSSRTVLQESGHPQELFFTDLCDYVGFQFIVKKVSVRNVCDNSGIKPEEYFVKFTYDPLLATFTSIDKDRYGLASLQRPPDNCPACPLLKQRAEERQDRKLKDGQGYLYGVAYGGNDYHLDDFILFRADSGAAQIGYITSIDFPAREISTVQTTVTVRLVGRISTLSDDILPEGIHRDERHVYLTEQEKTIPLQDLIRVCFALCPESFTTHGPHESKNLNGWLSFSPYHFYVRYVTPSLVVKSRRAFKNLPYQELRLCATCVTRAQEEREKMEDFLEYIGRNLLPTLDLFGGVGAFSMGLARGSRCLRVTDSIEKSPSAALTTQHNHPEIAVHNTCTNDMLRYTIKTKEGHMTQRPNQIFETEKSVPVPGPIKAAKCLVAGFPCQSHSRLNMYKKANDIKSNLILNAISWVDHLRPDICYFENVPGFLNFSFDAVQAGAHKVEGGTKMGGLKFLIRALLAMNYQVRFGLLQAAHYGTPQRRTRFFLIAAVDGHPLPELPQPTHDFLETQDLNVNLPLGVSIRSIRSGRGTAPHPTVTIRDAIGDLPRFDWKHPNKARERPTTRREISQRERETQTFEVEGSSAYDHCGFPSTIGYRHGPKTTYQARARENPTEDLQQFTRCFHKKKVERVVSIPMKPSADYRDLQADLQEWQASNPLSSTGRRNYRPGLYGRLDENGYFPTVVTNMHPTAKQSRVLNPWCKRMVTVRELARSQGFPDHFVFKALKDNVVTMHRQIGNAVPLPVGEALGRELRLALFKKWMKDRDNATVIDDLYM